MPLKLVPDDASEQWGEENFPDPPRHPVLTLDWDGLALPAEGAVSQLSIFQGETVLIWGADKAQRARIMRAAAGLAPGGPLPKAPRGIGTVLPEGSTLFADTPLETVMECSSLDPIAASGLLNLSGLSDVADCKLTELSKLDLRLLKLACACACAPGALVLDGVFDMLDGPARRRLIRAFAALRATRRMGVLLTGMDRNPLLPLASRMLELGAGPSIGAPPALLTDRRINPMPVPMQSLRRA